LFTTCLSHNNYYALFIYQGQENYKNIFIMIAKRKGSEEPFRS
jgi:hypothetical protein